MVLGVQIGTHCWQLKLGLMTSVAKMDTAAAATAAAAAAVAAAGTTPIVVDAAAADLAPTFCCCFFPIVEELVSHQGNLAQADMPSSWCKC
jgi:hypothetical protein